MTFGEDPFLGEGVFSRKCLDAVVFFGWIDVCELQYLYFAFSRVPPLCVATFFSHPTSALFFLRNEYLDFLKREKEQIGWSFSLFFRRRVPKSLFFLGGTFSLSLHKEKKGINGQNRDEFSFPPSKKKGGETLPLHQPDSSSRNPSPSSIIHPPHESHAIFFLE
jgi:hypothetical protein